MKAILKKFPQHTENSQNISKSSQGCFFEINDYGFRQKRIYGENLSVPVADGTRGLDFKEVLRPKNARYGSVTKYIAIDCEMDQISAHQFNGVYAGYGHNIPCKVSLVNQEGVIILDTLVRPCVDGKDVSSISEIVGHRSMEPIHGIKSEWLVDAPTFDSVREHILELCGAKLSPKEEEGRAPQDGPMQQDQETMKEVNAIRQDGSPPKSLLVTETGYSQPETEDSSSLKPSQAEQAPEPEPSIFVGHGVLTDLKVLNIYDVSYIDTQGIDRFNNQARKLQVLVEKHLNAQIQKGHHSAIIDARATLALFLKLKDQYGLEVEGFGVQWLPNYALHCNNYSGYLTNGNILTMRKRPRHGRMMTASKMVGRQAAKSLGGAAQQDFSAQSNGENVAIELIQTGCTIKNFDPHSQMASATTKLDINTFTDVELQIQNLILGQDEKIEKDRIYKFDKKVLTAQIDSVLQKEFVKLFRNLAYAKDHYQ